MEREAVFQVVFLFIIPLCSKRTTNTEYVSGVQYSCESRPCLKLPGTLSCAGGTIGITTDRKSAERTVLIANFRLFSRIFAIFSRK